MAHPDVDATTHELRPSAVLERLGGLGILLVLGVAVLNSPVGEVAPLISISRTV